MCVSSLFAYCYHFVNVISFSQLYFQKVITKAAATIISNLYKNSSLTELPLGIDAVEQDSIDCGGDGESAIPCPQQAVWMEWNPWSTW
jgi:hypothetical protein